MRRPYLILLVFLAAATAAAVNLRAQGALESIFPERFGRWATSTSSIKIKTEGERAQVYAEAGLVDSLSREYSNGSQKLALVITQFRDPSSAYEAYTAEINPSMQPSTVGGPSAVDHDRLLVLIGNFMLEIQQPQNPSTEELEQLAAMIRKRSDQTPLPPIRTYLPQGFTDGTQRYALGPNGLRVALGALHRSEYSGVAEEVGFASNAETMLAEYHSGKDSAVLLVIEYPTPQLAERHLHHLETVLPPIAKDTGARIERKGSLLSLVLAPTTAAYAESLRNAVNYETQVTWNEPTQTITDPPWATILGKIFIGTGLFMVVAVVLGVAFGGVRVLTKLFLPGKVFDRPEQMDVLQLGLSGKRIDSRDFY